jgi:hypothetical protein
VVAIRSLRRAGYTAPFENVTLRHPLGPGFAEPLCIDRQEARELIYGRVLKAAVGDAVDALEAELLDWLAKTWQVRVQVLDESAGD